LKNFAGQVVVFIVRRVLFFGGLGMGVTDWVVLAVGGV